MTLTSCLQESETEIRDVEIASENYSLVNGEILSFKYHQDFIKISDSLASLPQEDRIKFARSLGLKSYLECFAEAFGLIYAAKSKEEYTSLLKQYKKYIIEREGRLRIRTNYEIRASLLSKDGLVIIGGKLYSFNDKGQVIGDLNNENIMRDLFDSDVKYSELDYINSNPIRLKTVTPMAHWTESKKNNNNDRKAILNLEYRTEVYQYIGNPQCYYQPVMVGKGIPEKYSYKLFKGWDWYNYKTENTIQFVGEFKLNNGIHISFNGPAISNDWNVIYTRAQPEFPDEEGKETDYYLKMYDFYIKYTHRGMGGTWVEIDVEDENLW